MAVSCYCRAENLELPWTQSIRTEVTTPTTPKPLISRTKRNSTSPPTTPNPSNRPFTFPKPSPSQNTAAPPSPPPKNTPPISPKTHPSPSPPQPHSPPAKTYTSPLTIHLYNHTQASTYPYKPRTKFMPSKIFSQNQKKKNLKT
jgi:hypothetical protein